MKNVIVNAVLFQCLWFAAILSGASLALAALVPLVIHACIALKGLRPMTPYMLLVAWGVMMDSSLWSFGIYSSAREEAMLFGAMPLWLSFIWIGFVLTIPLSLESLVKRRKLFVLMCAIAGPVSYFAGARLGALNIDQSYLLLISGAWAATAVLALLAYDVSLKLMAADRSPLREHGQGLNKNVTMLNNE